MSDTAITQICTAIVTVAGLFTIWLKLRYGVEKTEEAVHRTNVVSKKVDDNTSLTTEVKASADKASLHVEGCDDRMKTLNVKLSDHDNRIREVESKLALMQRAVDDLGDNLKSTRHQILNVLQTLTNKTDLIRSDILITKATQPAVPVPIPSPNIANQK